MYRIYDMTCRFSRLKMHEEQDKQKALECWTLSANCSHLCSRLLPPNSALLRPWQWTASERIERLGDYVIMHKASLGLLSSHMCEYTYFSEKLFTDVAFKFSTKLCCLPYQYVHSMRSCSRRGVQIQHDVCKFKDNFVRP